MSERKRELCEPRYLQNANSLRNGTCKEDSIASLDYIPSFDCSAKDLHDLFLASLYRPTLFFTRVLYRSGMISHELSIIYFIGFYIESLVIVKKIITITAAVKVNKIIFLLRVFFCIEN